MHYNLLWPASLVLSLALGLLVYIVRSYRRRPAINQEDVAYPIEKQAHAPKQNGSFESRPLPKSVTAWDTTIIGRDQWVLRMTRHVFNERHGGRHNVLTINDDLEYLFTAEAVVEDICVEYREDSGHKVPYRVVVFRKGEVINLGDGGDINWDWMGNFIRPNAAQISFNPCNTGTQYQQDAWTAVARD